MGVSCFYEFNIKQYEKMNVSSNQHHDRSEVIHKIRPELQEYSLLQHIQLSKYVGFSIRVHCLKKFGILVNNEMNEGFSQLNVDLDEEVSCEIDKTAGIDLWPDIQPSN
jgi:hypothetical protein